MLWKLFECGFLSRLKPFLVRNNILYPYQHGFRTGQSTMTAVHDFYQRLMRHMEEGESPAGIVCDLSTAFDFVNLDLLLGKIESYGIRGFLANIST